jgi:release factor glutamine methyltransferase
MTIKQALVKYHRIEIDLLLALLLGKSKEFLFLHPAHELTRIQHKRLTRMVKRRLRGEPIAYILGYKDFYGLRFKVNRHVLIPRPETEVVVDLAISNVAKRSEKSVKKQISRSARDGIKISDGNRNRERIRILDIGTGSGNIIISLAKELGLRASAFAKASADKKGMGLSYRFYASDVSSAALKVAKQNAIQLPYLHTRLYECKRIKFIKSDLLNNIKGNFDIIIANLPYLSEGWKNYHAAESTGLKFEPKQALFAKEKGLMEIRKLLEQIAQRKQKPKLVYLEFDPRQKTRLLSLIKKTLPGSKIKFYRDYSNLWRYVEIEMRV